MNDSLDVEELFLGFYEAPSTTSKSLEGIIRDILHRYDLPVSNIRGQCYDGATNMSGIRSGVQTRLLKDAPRATFVHCVAHRVNLFIQDSVKAVNECRDTLAIVKDLINFVRDSPKRLSKFKSKRLKWLS